MPMYEYVCEKCGSHTEVIQKVSDAPLKRCQKCRGKLEKMVSRTSFQLKGSGWYLSDYSRKTNASSADKAEKKSESSSSTDTTCGAGACGSCD
ncbi:MAG TPA: zinc ribbon domain-containing protein [Blastocatellia bacterium]|nr:zinc ribbon domain-containing protein [Blastocatellia bacterium]